MDSTKRFAFTLCARSICALGALVALILVLASSVADATPMPIHGALQVTAQEGSDSATWQMNFSASGQVVWNSSAPVDLYSSSHPTLFLGSIDALSLSLSDPNVSLSFAVTAGNASTTFTISSPIVSFPTMTNPRGFATAAVTLTDNTGSGGSFTGLFPGAKGYQAQYNGRSVVYASLVSPFVVGPNTSAISSERFPVAGTTTVPGLVSDIESRWFFKLSANESASGTSRFNVVLPEPSSMVLAVLGFVGLAAWGWRRRSHG